MSHCCGFLPRLQCRRGGRDGWLRLGQLYQCVTQRLGLVRQALQQALTIGHLVSVDALTHVGNAVLQEAIHPLGDFASCGEDCFDTAAARLNAAVKRTQSIFGVMTALCGQTERPRRQITATPYPPAFDFPCGSLMLLSLRPADRVLDSRGPMSSERRASSWPTANRAIRAKNNIGDA